MACCSYKSLKLLARDLVLARLVNQVISRRNAVDTDSSTSVTDQFILNISEPPKNRYARRQSGKLRNVQEVVVSFVRCSFHVMLMSFLCVENLIKPHGERLLLVNLYFFILL